MYNKLDKNYNLKGKTAIITGSAGLLGKEHAIALLDIGAKVIMTDVDKVKLYKICSKLKKNIRQ